MSSDDKGTKRGGYRPNAGKPPSFVRVEIGTEPLKKFRKWNKLRKDLDYAVVDVETYIAQLFLDRVDSPSFDKAIENMEAEKKRREKQVDEEDDTFH